jgi:hypothetical protein
VSSSPSDKAAAMANDAEVRAAKSLLTKRFPPRLVRRERSRVHRSSKPTISEKLWSRQPRECGKAPILMHELNVMRRAMLVPQTSALDTSAASKFRNAA